MSAHPPDFGAAGLAGCEGAVAELAPGVALMTGVLGGFADFVGSFSLDFSLTFSADLSAALPSVGAFATAADPVPAPVPVPMAWGGLCSGVTCLVV